MDSIKWNLKSVKEPDLVVSVKGIRNPNVSCEVQVVDRLKFQRIRYISLDIAQWIDAAFVFVKCSIIFDGDTYWYCGKYRNTEFINTFGFRFVNAAELMQGNMTK